MSNNEGTNRWSILAIIGLYVYTECKDFLPEVGLSTVVGAGVFSVKRGGLSGE